MSEFQSDASATKKDLFEEETTDRRKISSHSAGTEATELTAFGSLKCSSFRSEDSNSEQLNKSSSSLPSSSSHSSHTFEVR